MLKRRSILIFSLCIALLLGGGITWFALTRPTRLQRLREPTPDQVKVTRDAQIEYKTLEMTPLDLFADLNTSQSYFDRVPIQDPQPGTVQVPAVLSDSELTQAKTKLRTVMAQFMHYRFTTTGDPERDVDRYLAWRHHRGDVVLPIDDHPPYNGDVYEYYLGSPFSPGTSLDRAFRDVYLAAERKAPPASRVVAISTDPSESLFVTWWQHTHIDTDQPVINHPRGNEYWLGGQTGSSSTWFKNSLQDARDNTRVQVRLHALAGIVIETKEGLRYPFKLWLIWNPKLQDWMIRGSSVSNVGLANSPALIY